MFCRTAAPCPAFVVVLSRSTRIPAGALEVAWACSAHERLWLGTGALPVGYTFSPLC